MAKLLAGWWWGLGWVLVGGVAAGPTYALPAEQPATLVDDGLEGDGDDHCTERLCEAWWQKDDAHLRTLRRQLVPSELTLEALRRAVERGDFNEASPIRDGGFGLAVWDLALYAGGYLSVRFSVAYFEGEFLEYRVYLGVNDHPWLRQAVAQVWQTPEGAESATGDTWIAERLVAEGARTKLEARLARELGPQLEAPVPDELRDSYRRLQDRVQWERVSYSSCGIGAAPSQYFLAMREMVANQRTDLLSNLLRSPNPSGRIYAAAAWRKLEAQGLKLEAEVLEALRKVEALPLEFETCEGCLVSSVNTSRALALLAEGWDLW